MIRRRDASSRSPHARDAGDAAPTLAQLSASLRRARISQGLAPADAGARAGISTADVDALESGAAGRLADHVGTVAILRRYAESLGLPGDRCALALLDAWPAEAGGRSGAAAPSPGAAGPAPTGTGLSGTAGPGASGPGGPVGTAAPAPGGQITAAVPTTASLRQDLGPWNAPAAAEATGLHGTAGTATGPATGILDPAVPHHWADTGITPMVAPGPPPPRQRGRAGTVLLRALVVLILVLVVLGAAGLAVNHWRPQWLRSLQLPHSPITNPPATDRTGQTTTTAPPFAATPTGPHTATLTVHSPHPTVEVQAISGPSWVQVTDSNHPNPIYAAVLPAGSNRSFPVSGVLTIQTGSSTAHLVIRDGTKDIGSYSPTAAPFTTTVRTG